MRFHSYNLTFKADLMSKSYLTNMFEDFPTTCPLTLTVAMVSNPSQDKITLLLAYMSDDTAAHRGRENNFRDIRQATHQSIIKKICLVPVIFSFKNWVSVLVNFILIPFHLYFRPEEIKHLAVQ